MTADGELAYVTDDSHQPAQAGEPPVVTSTADAGQETAITRIEGRNGGTLTPFTEDSARSAAMKRWHGAVEAAWEGVADAGDEVPELSSRDSHAAIRYGVRQHTLNWFDPSAPGSAASGKLVLGLLKPERSAADDSPQQAAAAAFGTEAARQALSVFRELMTGALTVTETDGDGGQR